MQMLKLVVLFVICVVFGIYALICVSAAIYGITKNPAFEKSKGIVLKVTPYPIIMGILGVLMLNLM